MLLCCPCGNCANRRTIVENSKQHSISVGVRHKGGISRSHSTNQLPARGPRFGSRRREHAVPPYTHSAAGASGATVREAPPNRSSVPPAPAAAPAPQQQQHPPPLAGLLWWNTCRSTTANSCHCTSNSPRSNSNNSIADSTSYSLHIPSHPPCGSLQPVPFWVPVKAIQQLLNPS
jgi:hypothetical protein